MNANAVITGRDGNTLTVDLVDKTGKVLDTYVIDVGSGIAQSNTAQNINLPQTGVYSWGSWITAGFAVLLICFGFAAVKCSGILRRKEEDQESTD